MYLVPHSLSFFEQLWQVKKLLRAFTPTTEMVTSFVAISHKDIATSQCFSKWSGHFNLATRLCCIEILLFGVAIFSYPHVCEYIYVFPSSTE